MVMRKRNKKRDVNHLCPNCMSTITLVDGNYECSGDRLVYWKEEFNKYEKLTKKGKENYLDTLSDVEKFLSLYEKDTLSCDFSTRIVTTTALQGMEIADPMVVGKIERSLNRLLFEHELEEDYIFYRKEKDFSLVPLEGYKPFKIPRINFPSDM